MVAFSNVGQASRILSLVPPVLSALGFAPFLRVPWDVLFGSSFLAMGYSCARVVSVEPRDADRRALAERSIPGVRDLASGHAPPECRSQAGVVLLAENHRHRDQELQHTLGRCRSAGEHRQLPRLHGAGHRAPV